MGFEPTPEVKKKMSMSLKSYMKPTPTLMRKIGDGLLAMSTMVTGSAIITDHSSPQDQKIGTAHNTMWIFVLSV